MSFVAEEVLLRQYPKVSRLLLPFIVLFAASAAIGISIDRLTETWQINLLWGIAGGLVLIFWLLPVVSWLTSWIELTNQRVIVRRGWFGTKTKQASFLEVATVTTSKGSLLIGLKNGETITAEGFGKLKALVADIDYLAKNI